MTYKEIVEKYEKMFILIMETTDDPVYKKCESVFKENIYETPENKKQLDRMIEIEADFSNIISFYILSLISESNSSFLELGDDNEVVRRVNDFWVRYLKKPTRSFTSKYGLDCIDSNEIITEAHISNNNTYYTND